MRRLWSYIVLTGTSLVLMGATFANVFKNSTSNIEYSDGREMVISNCTFLNSFAVKHHLFDDCYHFYDFRLGVFPSMNIINNAVNGYDLKRSLESNSIKIYNKKDYEEYEYFDEDSIKERCNDKTTAILLCKNGIIIDDKYTVSSDCERILYCDNQLLPSKEELDHIDLSREKEKYIELINNSDLLPPVKDELTRGVDLEKSKKYYYNIKKMYEKIPVIKQAIKASSIVTSHSLSDYMFSHDEMRAVVDYLMNYYKDQLEEYSKPPQQKQMSKRFIYK